MERKTQVQYQLGPEPLFLACLLFALAAISCVPNTEPPAKPTEAVVVQEDESFDFQVKDDQENAWATLSVVDSFDLLTTGNFQDPTISNWQVTTDGSGQAQLCPSGDINISTQTCADVACRIYVYEHTVFGPYPCPKSGVGTTACSMMGAQALADCHMTIDTISASATGLGTWYSLIYLWDSQMSIVIAGEGIVEVTPIVTLEFQGDVPPLTQMEPLERAFAARQIEILERVLGRSEEVRIEEDKPQFLYTAPDTKLEELGLDPDLPDRVWHPTDQLPVLVQQLRIIEPRLVPWLGRIWERATLDDIYIGPPESIIPSEQLVVVTAGEVWEVPSLQDSILYAVDWLVLTEEILAEPLLRVGAVNQERAGSLKLLSPDAREIGYDPERARTLFVEAGYDQGVQMVLLVPDDDDSLLKAADLIAEQMAVIGVDLAIEVVPVNEFQDTSKTLVLEGISVLTLNRR